MTTTSANTQDILSALSAIASQDYLRVEGSAVAVAPGDTEQVAATLRFAHAHRLAAVPRGGGTKHGWGHPVTPAIVIDTFRLQTVKEHTWQDMTCTVQAGCKWAALQTALAQHGQWVALDPLWPDRATVGGVVATNDSGLLRLRYGGLRDLIIGMTIVLADGTVANTGGKVVKNVAGYDLHKLMIGAFGTLGVITSVNFRLHSIPQSTQSLTFSAGSVEPLGKLMLQLLHGQLSTVAIQLRGAADAFQLDIQLASLPEVLQAQSEELQQMAQAAGLTVSSAANEVWQTRQQRMDHDFACKGTMLPSEIARFAEWVRREGGESVTQATGIMLAGFPAAAVDRIPRLRAELEAAGGSLMVLKQPQPAMLPCWGTAPDSLPLMREVKRRFDPEGILNPGRFLGNI